MFILINIVTRKNVHWYGRPSPPGSGILCWWRICKYYFINIYTDHVTNEKILNPVGMKITLMLTIRMIRGYFWDVYWETTSWTMLNIKCLNSFRFYEGKKIRVGQLQHQYDINTLILVWSASYCWGKEEWLIWMAGLVAVVVNAE